MVTLPAIAGFGVMAVVLALRGRGKRRPQRTHVTEPPPREFTVFGRASVVVFVLLIPIDVLAAARGWPRGAVTLGAGTVLAGFGVGVGETSFVSIREQFLPGYSPSSSACCSLSKPFPRGACSMASPGSCSAWPTGRRS